MNKLLFLLFLIPSFLFATVNREISNYKARKSTWEIWADDTTVSEQDTVMSDTTISLINGGWHSVMLRGIQDNDSIQIQLQYAVSFYDEVGYIHYSVWHNITTYTNTLYDVIQFYPPTSRYIKFRRIGLADNGYNARLILRYAQWNIE